MRYTGGNHAEGIAKIGKLFPQKNTIFRHNSPYQPKFPGVREIFGSNSENYLWK
jgi:hypothetical protein